MKAPIQISHGRREGSSLRPGPGPLSRALLSGHLVSRASLAKMMQTAPASQDGLGIFATDLPCGRFWGHSGRILDYRTVVDASGNSARIAVISVRGPIGHDPDDSALLCPSSASNTS